MIYSDTRTDVLYSVNYIIPLTHERVENNKYKYKYRMEIRYFCFEPFLDFKNYSTDFYFILKLFVEFWVLLENPPHFELKLMYSYVIELADSKSDLVFFSSALVSEIMVFLRIRVTCMFLIK